MNENRPLRPPSARLVSPASRRRLLLVAAAASGLLATGCAGLRGERTLEISEARLLEALNGQFPFNSRVLGALDLVALSPRLRLLPQENRLGTEFDLKLGAFLGSRPVRGTVGLSYGLRYDPASRSVRLSEPRVERLDLTGWQGQREGSLSRVATALAEDLLSELSVYELKPEDLQQLDARGYQPGPIRVTERGLAITLQPVR
ncbi:DUF1439 domain-containing protein [Aquabacterium sp. A7-Y]|uniref:hypothetical protein n=1 Tax=Aquabacterium sp. A7-Y TaxID=1349605 RepID=UPI00223E8037|nr:hypothetical protein [Aquabacterium sp. A7-Y]MCW7538255.1 DUF1439 domain-containing protein [Aquabacterium sp. A7-Y]